jgi:HEAT repeat protein
MLASVMLPGAELPSRAPAPTSAALGEQARAVLHQIMVSEQSWVRIHAAEALMAAGETDAIRTYFLNELPRTESSAFRIGVWRVLAAAARSPEERATWIAKVERVYLDPTAPDQNQAIETLCKLGYHVSGPTLALVRRRLAEPPSAPMVLALWSAQIAGEPQALAGLTQLLTAGDPALRRSAAYALRWLHPSDPAARQALARAAAAATPNLDPSSVYILGAALAVDADPAQTKNWVETLNLLMATNAVSVGERFEASWTLQHRYKVADLPPLAGLLDLPDSENDVRIGAAMIILATLAHP